MPQAEEYLQEQFMKDGSDGIAECEKLITDAGGSISKGWHISFPVHVSEIPRNVWEACLFLCHEWDYAYDFNEEDKEPPFGNHDKNGEGGMFSKEFYERNI